MTEKFDFEKCRPTIIIITINVQFLFKFNAMILGILFEYEDINGETSVYQIKQNKYMIFHI